MAGLLQPSRIRQRRQPHRQNGALDPYYPCCPLCQPACLPACLQPAGLPGWLDGLASRQGLQPGVGEWLPPIGLILIGLDSILTMCHLMSPACLGGEPCLHPSPLGCVLWSCRGGRLTLSIHTHTMSLTPRGHWDHTHPPLHSVCVHGACAPIMFMRELDCWAKGGGTKGSGAKLIPYGPSICAPGHTHTHTIWRKEASFPLHSWPT